MSLSPDPSVLLGPLQGLLNWFQKNRIHRDAQMDAALESINNALFASMEYAETQKKMGSVDRHREYELAELWATASSTTRHASRELAERLRNKSLFWTRQMKWSREEVLAKGIDFDNIQREIAALLRKK